MLARRIRAIVAVIVAAVFFYGFLPFYADGTFTFFGDHDGRSPGSSSSSAGRWQRSSSSPSSGSLCLLRRGATSASPTSRRRSADRGIVSAIISAPISAVVFGGVTGSGTDLLVAAFQQAGSDLQTAVLQQGLLSDPIDKTLTFFVVFASCCRRCRGGSSPRFPQGEKAVGLEGASGRVAGLLVGLTATLVARLVPAHAQRRTTG